MSKLRTRRGAVVVLVAIMAVALVALTGLAMDFSRLWSLRNELQTSADAAAHAGAVQLSPPNNAAFAYDSAMAFALRNLAMQDSVTVDLIELGDWDDVGKTFTPNAPNTDAVHVVVSRQSTGLVLALLGVPLPRLKAQAIGWADAPVSNATGCMKPWAIPYTQLISRINNYRGIPNTPDASGLYRPWDPVNDIEALNHMSPTERTFSLKIGSGKIYDTVGTVSGNYQAVQLGKYWSVADSDYANPPPGNGAPAYQDHLSGVTCHQLTVGDSLLTEQGHMPGPTVCGILGVNAQQGCGGTHGPGVCMDVIGEGDNTPQTDPTYGDCVGPDGQVGVDIKAAFFTCATCNGHSVVSVDLLGSFTLVKVYPDKPKNGVNLQFDRAQILGIFKPVQDGGDVGSGSTTLVKPILVK